MPRTETGRLTPSPRAAGSGLWFNFGEVGNFTEFVTDCYVRGNDVAVGECNHQVLTRYLDDHVGSVEFPRGGATSRRAAGNLFDAC